METQQSLIGVQQNQGLAELGLETLLTVDTVAALLQLKPATVREKAMRGEIPAVRIGREYRFKPSALKRWIDRQATRLL
jgi:excisionase family DNA binding protein